MILKEDAHEHITETTIKVYKTPDGVCFNASEKNGYTDALRHVTTHIICKQCGVPVAKTDRCDLCSKCRYTKRFNDMKSLKWDQKNPVMSYMSDDIFFDIDTIFEFCELHDIDMNNIKLVHTQPVKMDGYNSDDMWYDVVACSTDSENIERPDSLDMLVEAFNIMLSKIDTGVYMPVDIRADINHLI